MKICITEHDKVKWQDNISYHTRVQYYERRLKELSAK